MADHLEKAKREAILLMVDIRESGEIDIRRADSRLLWLGFGWLIAAGWIVYRGNYRFAWSKDGRNYAKTYLDT